MTLNTTCTRLKIHCISVTSVPKSQISRFCCTINHFWVTDHFEKSTPNGPKVTLNTIKSNELHHMHVTSVPKVPNFSLFHSPAKCSQVRGHFEKSALHDMLRLILYMDYKVDLNSQPLTNLIFGESLLINSTRHSFPRPCSHHAREQWIHLSNPHFFGIFLDSGDICLEYRSPQLAVVQTEVIGQKLKIYSNTMLWIFTAYIVCFSFSLGRNKLLASPAHESLP